MSKAKITDFDFMGNKGNILDVGSWGKIILGGFAVLTGFAISQNLFNKAGKVIPKFDSSIDPIVSRPQPADTNKKRYVR